LNKYKIHMLQINEISEVLFLELNFIHPSLVCRIINISQYNIKQRNKIGKIISTN